jgi:hypothetical protein
VDRFRTGDIPEAVAYSCFPVPDTPSAKWSLFNRTIMFFSGTADARGYRQWQQVSRFVKKGAKAMYILVPMIRKKEVDGDDVSVLAGFKASPVFRYEDTEGQELEYMKVSVPELPLIERAEEWGISVKAVPGSYKYLGYYSVTQKEIGLASKDECVFFHELAHCAHEKTKGKLEAGQDPLQEIVADLSAQALCILVGKSQDRYLKNTHCYIEQYAAQLKLSPVNACLRVMGEVEKVLHLILGKGGGLCTAPR